MVCYKKASGIAWMRDFVKKNLVCFWGDLNVLFRITNPICKVVHAWFVFVGYGMVYSATCCTCKIPPAEVM